jgi:hypothetical protein
MLARLLVASTLLWAVPVASVDAGERSDRLGQLKVAYIYNFTRFIDWPALPAERPFVTCVTGDPEMTERLRVLEREGRRAQGRSIEIHGFETADVPESCQVLFVGRGAEGELEAILRRTDGKPTLLVGDTPGYAGRGVAIEFFLRPDVFREKQRLRFRIDPDALAGRGLAVSAQLMDVAEVVE